MLKYYENNIEMDLNKFYRKLADVIIDDLHDYSQGNVNYEGRLSSKLIQISADYVNGVVTTFITNYAEDAINGIINEFELNGNKYKIKFMFDCDGKQQMEMLRKVLGVKK